MTLRGMEERLKVIEDMLKEIHSFLVLGKTLPSRGMAEYLKAVEALVDGDRSLLKAYMAKGGKIYSEEELISNGYIEPVTKQDYRPQRRKQNKGLSSRAPASRKKPKP